MGHGPTRTVPPEYGGGAVLGILHGQTTVLSRTADGRFAEGAQIADGKGQRRVAGPEGSEAANVGYQVQSKVWQFEVGVDD